MVADLAGALTQARRNGLSPNRVTVENVVVDSEGQSPPARLRHVARRRQQLPRQAEPGTASLDVGDLRTWPTCSKFALTGGSALSDAPVASSDGRGREEGFLAPGLPRPGLLRGRRASGGRTHDPNRRAGGPSTRTRACALSRKPTPPTSSVGSGLWSGCWHGSASRAPGAGSSCSSGRAGAESRAWSTPGCSPPFAMAPSPDRPTGSSPA